MFNKIIVCLDGSSLAEQILPYATEQAQRFGSKLVLLQVLVPRSATSLLPENQPIVAGPEAIKKDEKEAKEYLERLAQPPRQIGLDVDCVTILGAPGDGIVSYAAKNQCDLIAIATHGRSGLKRLFFGSVAEYVLKQSGLPILLIKPK